MINDKIDEDYNVTADNDNDNCNGDRSKDGMVAGTIFTVIIIIKIFKNIYYDYGGMMLITFI